MDQLYNYIVKLIQDLNKKSDDTKNKSLHYRYINQAYDLFIRLPKKYHIASPIIQSYMDDISKEQLLYLKPLTKHIDIISQLDNYNKVMDEMQSEDGQIDQQIAQILQSQNYPATFTPDQVLEAERTKYINENKLSASVKQNDLLQQIILDNYNIIPLYTQPQKTETSLSTTIYGAEFINKKNQLINFTVNVPQLVEPENQNLLFATLQKVQTTELNDLIKKKMRIGQPDEKQMFIQLGNNTNIKFATLAQACKAFYFGMHNPDLYNDGNPESTNQFLQNEGIQFQMFFKEQGGKYISNPVFEKKFSKALYFVRNNDDACLYAALFLAYVYKMRAITLGEVEYKFSQNDFMRKLQKYQDNQNQNLFHFTQLLINELQINEPYDNQIIRSFESHFQKRVLIINQNEEMSNLPDSPDQLILYKTNEPHYTVVTSYTAFIGNINAKFDSKYYSYCYQHQNWFDKKYKCKHCIGNCKKCFACQKYHENKGELQVCDACGIKYYKGECEEAHKKICKKFETCSDCKHKYFKNHMCEFANKNLFQQIKLKSSHENFITFDIESLFKPTETKYISEHVPFVICYQLVKYENLKYKIVDDEQYMYTNNFNGIQKKGFYIVGLDCCERFIDMLLNPVFCNEYKQIYAHNGSKYDNILILQKNIQKYKTDILMPNGRLIQLGISDKVNTIFIKDSCLLVAMPLKKFNENLQLGMNLEKEEQDYKFMTTTILEIFIQQGGQFDKIKNCKLQNVSQQYLAEHAEKDYVQRYIDYCIQDVNILSQGLIKFSEMFDQNFGISILQYLTISSATQALYLANSNKNANGPSLFEMSLYDKKFNKSKVEKKFQKIIQDVNNFNKIYGTDYKTIEVLGTNVKVGKYNIDLQVKLDDEIAAIEVDGVYFHGLALNDEKQSKSVTSNKVELQKRLTAHNIKNDYLIKNLQTFGYQQLFRITDLQVEDFIKENDLIIDIDNNFNIDNRDVFRGGRTECFVNKRKFDPTKFCLKAFDLTSQYPSMMMHNLPLSNPVVTEGGDTQYINNLTNYALNLTGTAEELLIKYLKRESEKRVGFVKCKILPPQNLQTPCLGVKINGKLLFPLCRTCAQNQACDMSNKAVCTHSVEQRVLYGYFPDCEMIQAIHLGYRIQQVYETIIYQKSAYNTPEFVGNKYVQKLTYFKTLNSDAADYNKEVLQALDDIIDFKLVGQKVFIKIKGSEMEFEQIKENKALKQIYKLMLNSLYGRFGMNIVRQESQVVQTQEELDQLVYSGQNCQIKNIGNKWLVKSDDPEELQILKKCKSNFFLAGYVTASSRICLYQLQEHIRQNYKGEILYSDTDSCYCLVPIEFKSVQNFPLKMTLGIKNEIAISDANEWVCIGSKAYAYTNGKKYKQAGKGITIKGDSLELKEGTNERVFDIYNSIVTGELGKKFEVKQESNFNIQHTTQNLFKIFTNDNYSKTIQMNECKRLMQNDFSTIPFGFVKQQVQQVEYEPKSIVQCVQYNEQKRLGAINEFVDISQLETKQKTMLQYLCNSAEKPLSLFFDIDADIQIEKLLDEIIRTYNIDVIYINKSDLINKNKYHIFCPQIVYANIVEMNYDLFKGNRKNITQICQIEGKSAVDNIYCNGRLLRLPYQYKNVPGSLEKNVTKGRYTLFYEYRNGQFKKIESPDLSLYVVQDQLDKKFVNQEVQLPKIQIPVKPEKPEKQVKLADQEKLIGCIEKYCKQYNLFADGSYKLRADIIMCLLFELGNDVDKTMQILQQLVSKQLFKETFGTTSLETTVLNLSKKQYIKPLNSLK
ncbi:Conserved_hypothetical protein [Hexamita inflata]|uniref:DNA-directed DNA polymerase n=1 Tax=Hexamita inflata TaxID=28002 RepID=A0AA86REA9_9EUKA|nr:Conserved hypothetical protein [Hexamita inflata]